MTHWQHNWQPNGTACYAPPTPYVYPSAFVHHPVQAVSQTPPPRYGTPVNPPPWEMAPWLYYRPIPGGYQYPGNGNSYTQNQSQTVNYPTNPVSPQPLAAPAPTVPPPEPTTAPQAAAPLRRDEIDPTPEPPELPQPPKPPTDETTATKADEKAPLETESAKAGKEPDLPLPTDDYPLTKDLINQWDAALDDPHPFHGNRVPTAFEIARFLEEHPHVTLTGKPREIMTRFAENILSTHRSDADNEYEVERDAMLVAIDQGFFYNPPERVLKHIRDIAKRGIGLHGQEQPLAASILRKYDKGIFKPTQDIVDETMKKFPWLKAQQTEPIETQSNNNPDTDLMATTSDTPIRGALATNTAPLGNVDTLNTFDTTAEPPKEKRNLWTRIRHPFLKKKTETELTNNIPNLDATLNGQQLDITSAA